MINHDAASIIGNTCGFDRSSIRMYVKSSSYDWLSAAFYNVSDLELSW